MKKCIIMIVAMLLWSMAGIQAQRTYVLSVGVAHYQDNSHDLRNPDKDAIRVKELFAQHSKDVTVMTSSYATHNGILDKLRQICTQSKPEGRIIFFFSGHGFRGGLVAYDTFIHYDELIKELKKAKAGTKVCLFDACLSGSVTTQEDGRPQWSGLSGDTTMVFFLSSRGDEYSIESPLLGAGLFTNSLLKALRGMSDVDGDKSITVEELFRYIYGDVVLHSKEIQHPQLIATKRMRESVILKW